MVTAVTSKPKVEGSIGVVVSVVTQGGASEPASRAYMRSDFTRDLKKASRPVKPMDKPTATK
jgi:hypothetical protein